MAEKILQIKIHQTSKNVSESKKHSGRECFVDSKTSIERKNNSKNFIDSKTETEKKSDADKLKDTSKARQWNRVIQRQWASDKLKLSV